MEGTFVDDQPDGKMGIYTESSIYYVNIKME